MKRSSYKDSMRVASAAFWAVVLLLILAAITSCSRKVYIPLQNTRSDTVYITRHDSAHVKDSVVLHHVTNIKDSIAIRDSVVIIQDASGAVKERIKIRYVDRWHTSADNLTLMRELSHYKAANDSMRAVMRELQQVPVAIPDQPKPTFWQKLKTRAAAFVVGLVFGLLATLLYKARKILIPCVVNIIRFIFR